MSLIDELKRRNVFRVGGAYLALGWIVTQVTDTVGPALNLPSWITPVVVWIGVIGFPFVLIFSWVFELTPEGLKREREVDRAASITHLTARRLDQLTIGLVVVAIALYLLDPLRAARSPPREEPAVVQARAVTIGPATATHGHRRLAVLPLANFSPDPANGFFADGLHDDMLTALSRLQGVDVVSRTTMQTFRDSKLVLAEIAQKIGATHVIEGSVRRDEVRVRLTVQLIDAQTDAHLWAETYDRPLADAMTLQSTVAKEVARVLEVAIGGTASEAPPTTVPAAYDLYLKARLQTNMEEQLKLLHSALLLDPAFTQARAARASAACMMLWFDEMQRPVLAPQARADIDRARAERQELPEIEIAEANYAYRVQRDYRGALARMDRVLGVDANNVEALGMRSFLLRRLGRREEALAAARRMHQLDPGNPATTLSVAEILTDYGIAREALQLFDAALAQTPASEALELDIERARARLHITGDLAAFEQWAASGRDRSPVIEEWYWWARGPSAERLAYYAARPGDWVKLGNAMVYPGALDVAIDADLMGDQAALQKALDEAERLYATLAPEVMARPEVFATHARILALRGESAAAVAAVERALTEMPPSVDAVVASVLRYRAIYTLARAGARDRALDLLQSIVEEERIQGVALHPANAEDYYNTLDRALLGDNPRYQALLAKIAARFEPL